MVGFCVVSEFRSGKAPIMVATDVAARGLGKFLVRWDSMRGSQCLLFRGAVD